MSHTLEQIRASWQDRRDQRRSEHELSRLSPNVRDEYLDYLAAVRRSA